MKRIKLILVLFAGFSFTEVLAQQTITTSGGNASGSKGSVSYSVGQIVYKNIGDTAGSVLQGVQQPYEISVISGFVEVKYINLILSAYPNPVNDNLILKVENSKIENLTYQLYDNCGRLLCLEKINNAETYIPMEMLANGTYFLKVSNSNTELKVLKIVKNN